MRDAGGQLRSRIFARASLSMVAKQIDRRNEFLSAYSESEGKLNRYFQFPLLYRQLAKAPKRQSTNFVFFVMPAFLSVRPFVRSKLISNHRHSVDE